MIAWKNYKLTTQESNNEHFKIFIRGAIVVCIESPTPVP